MKHKIIKIKDVEIVKEYTIRVVFEDGENRIIDLEPILYGTLYGPLRNRELFSKVTVNSEVSTIEWPNGADFDPETLYNWDHYKDELAERAAKWKFPESA